MLIGVGAVAGAHLRRHAGLIVGGQIALWLPASGMTTPPFALTLLLLGIAAALIATREQSNLDSAELQRRLARERAAGAPQHRALHREQRGEREAVGVEALMAAAEQRREVEAEQVDGDDHHEQHRGADDRDDRQLHPADGGAAAHPPASFRSAARRSGSISSASKSWRTTP
jgi:hypothetical protein